MSDALEENPPQEKEPNTWMKCELITECYGCDHFLIENYVDQELDDFSTSCTKGIFSLHGVDYLNEIPDECPMLPRNQDEIPF